MSCVENDFSPRFVNEHTTVTVSASKLRGDAVAVLEAKDQDLTATCHDDLEHCPCARPAFAIESGNDDGVFAIDGTKGTVTAASDLAGRQGRVYKLYVS